MSKEIRVQIWQTLFHFCMASIICFGSPAQYLQNPIEAQMAIFDQGEHEFHESWGVCIPYLLSTTYHCLLYFWDPVTNTPLKIHHVASLFLGPILLIYNQIGAAFTLMVLVYFFDFFSFYTKSHRICQEKGPFLVASMIKIHHMVTLMLLGVSWVKNLTPFGIWMLFVHDVTDVPMFIVRILRKQQVNFTRVIIVAASVLLSWSYYRVWCLFFLIMQSIYYLIYNPHLHTEHVYFYIYCIFGLMVLFSFNVYWTVLVASKCVKEFFMGNKTSTDNE
jgi:hypothetical protein